MLMLLTMALRNLRRNLRRTLITLLAISGGLTLMIFQDAIQAGSYRQLVRTGVSTMAGHVVVQAEGYQADPEMERLLPEVAAVTTSLEAAFPDARVVQRALVQGLLQSPRNATGIGVSGVEPDGETAVSDWKDKLVAGEWLSGSKREIVLGDGVAKSLEVEPGDKVVLLIQGPDEVVSQLFRVKGLFRTGSSELDGAFGIAPVATLTALLDAPGAAHQVSVHLPDPRGAEAATARAKVALEATDGLEVLHWTEALPDLHAFILRDQQSGRSMLFVIGIIVAMGVLNTVLMSVMERVRELGVMLAVGLTPARVAGLVMLEGALLGALAAAVGGGIGLALVLPLSKTGLDLAAMMGGESVEVAGVALNTVIYPTVEWPVFAAFCGLAWLFTVLSSVWPALHAARLKPVDAMRHV